jgi:PKD repeat protein
VVPGQYGETINHYNVLRTLEDAYGLAPLGSAATAAPIVDIWASPSGNQPPAAAFTSSCVELACSFDASGSHDSDGSVVSYAWNFGDGSAGSGSAPAHTYAAGGTDQVTLTVTDDGGATGTVTHAVTVAPPPGTGSTVAADEFGRTVSGGWGSADVGGVWSRVGSASLFSVGAGVGLIRVPTAGGGPTVLLGSVSAADVDLLVDLSVDKVATGGGQTVVLMARRSGSSDYRLKVRFLAGGVMHLAWSRVVVGAERTLGEVLVKGLTYSPGQVLRVRFDVSGAGAGVTALSGSVWPVGSVEPASPVISGTDSEPSLQGAGSIGIQAGLASTVTNAPVSFSFDNLSVTDTSGAV